MLFNVWVTNACNFRCKYCYVLEYERNININMADDILRFIHSNVREEKEVIINFHGGEPVLNYEIVKYMVGSLDKIFGNRVLYGMTTNGSLLTQEIIEFIAEKFVYNLSISLDGTKEINDANRRFRNGTGTYETVISHFLSLNKIRPDVRVRMTYNSDTICELFNNVRHIVELGFKNIVAVADYTDKNWNELDVDILQVELEKIFSLYFHNNQVDINFISDLITKKKGLCNGGKSSLNIDIDGNLYPCTWAVGNIDFVIGDIYKGIDNRRVQQLHKHSMVINKDCKGCTLYECCAGTRCKIINKIITNDFHQAPIFRCQYNNISYQLQKKYNII